MIPPHPGATADSDPLHDEWLAQLSAELAQIPYDDSETALWDDFVTVLEAFAEEQGWIVEDGPYHATSLTILLEDCPWLDDTPEDAALRSA